MEKESPPERRSEERRKSRVNKLVHTRIETDSGDFQTFMYLVDISLGGLRANLDHRLERDSRIRMSFPLKPYLQEELEAALSCRVVWNRDLVGGTFVHGFQFVELEQPTLEVVERLFIAFSLEGKRKRFRLHRVLNVSYRTEKGWVSKTAFDISPEGLGLQMDAPPEQGQLYPLKIYLEDRGKFDPVEVEGRVTYILEMDDEPCRVGVQFQDPGSDCTDRIKAFIDLHTR